MRQAKREQQISNMMKSSPNLSLEFTPTRDDKEKVEIMHQVVETLFMRPRQDYLQKARNRDFVMRRAILANLMVVYTSLSDTEMGKALNMDRTNILHHVRSHDGLMKTDPLYREWYTAAESLYARTNLFAFDDVPELSDLVTKMRDINVLVENMNNLLGTYLIEARNGSQSSEGQVPEGSLVELES